MVLVKNQWKSIARYVPRPYRTYRTTPKTFISNIFKKFTKRENRRVLGLEILWSLAWRYDLDIFQGSQRLTKTCLRINQTSNMKNSKKITMKIKKKENICFGGEQVKHWFDFLIILNVTLQATLSISQIKEPLLSPSLPSLNQKLST